MAWHGSAWSGMVRLGVAWHGSAWPGSALRGLLGRGWAGQGKDYNHLLKGIQMAPLATSERGEVELIGVASAQAMLGCTADELLKHVNLGELPCFDLGNLGVIRFRVADVNSLVYTLSRSHLAG